MTVRLDWGSIARLVLAHHPRCHPYRNDTYRLGPVHLCIGCFTAYPIAFIGLVLLAHLQPLTWWAWLGTGVAIGSLQFLSVAGWTRTRPRKIGVKVALGIGLAATTYGLFAAPWALGVRLALFGLFVLLCGLAMLPRGLRMRQTCQTCFFKADWERCSGMALIKPPSPPRQLPPRSTGAAPPAPGAP